MKVNYIIHNITFEWDSLKAAANLHKHGVPFKIACEAFFDPFIHYLEDNLIDGELRETIIGLTENWQFLYIVYVMRSDVIRIVSARLATITERKIYENE